jgi:DNA-directed RNA polymerase specialized sigma24 family protein
LTCPDDLSGSSGFESFFREQYAPVVRLAQGVVGDFQAAQDVAQDVFLAAYRHFPDGVEQAAGWVRVAALHTALNLRRGGGQGAFVECRSVALEWLVFER